MTLARFKDLCLDANDCAALGDFWSSALGLRRRGAGGADLVLRSPDAKHDGAYTLWLNQVPEPRVGKTRVHLDLRLPAPDPAPLLAAGARIEREPNGDPWWVLVDPEGNVFCAFPPAVDRRSTPGVFELIVDCSDPVAQATWWQSIVGGRVESSDGFASVVGAAGFPWEFWVFNPVPEPKAVKNRLHWDVDLVGADPSALLAVGATVLREPAADTHWWVLADPEGNEFCAFPAAT